MRRLNWGYAVQIKEDDVKETPQARKSPIEMDFVLILDFQMGKDICPAYGKPHGCESGFEL
jgi:hypothetical protein